MTLDEKVKQKTETTSQAAVSESAAVLAARAKVAALKARSKRPGGSRLTADERVVAKVWMIAQVCSQEKFSCSKMLKSTHCCRHSRQRDLLN